MALYGGIEAGGTKFVCCVASGPEDVRSEARFPTTSPAETLNETINFFRNWQETGETLAGLGVASFGPVDLDLASPTYGHITTTPKPGWANTDIVGLLADAFGLPVAFDTDVNAAALGEFRWGTAQGADPCLYLTIGTGIGGGGIYNGQPLHGLIHPEMGHIFLPHDRQADPFEGFCPFHGDCFEGLAAGPAIERRWGKPGADLPTDHPAWALEAQYIGLALASLTCTLSPRRIVLGGGVMQKPGLLGRVQTETRSRLNGYLKAPEIVENIQDYIVLPGLGNRSGMLGAIALAQMLVPA